MRAPSVLISLQYHLMVSEVQDLCTAKNLTLLETFSTYMFNLTLPPIKSVFIEGDCFSLGYVIDALLTVAHEGFNLGGHVTAHPRDQI